MELTKQVTSLEISKKLKELWFEKESIFFYRTKWRYFSEVYFKWNFACGGGDPTIWWFKEIPAYTASELMEYLPAYIDWYCLESTKSEDNKYFCVYMFDQSTIWEIKWKDTLSDALWLMLIYLLENNLLPYEPTNN